jgi:protein-tyrosine-phosphatase
MKKSIGIRILTATALAATLGACATSKSVDQKIADAQAQSSKKIESVEGQVEDLQNKQKATDTHLQQTDAALAELSTEAKDALKEMQVDLGHHKSHEMARDQIKDADVIYGMTKAHVQAVLDIAPFAKGKVFTLDPEGNDVPDPIGQSPAEYRSTAARLKQLVERRLTELLASQETLS